MRWPLHKEDEQATPRNPDPPNAVLIASESPMAMLEKSTSMKFQSSFYQIIDRKIAFYHKTSVNYTHPNEDGSAAPQQKARYFGNGLFMSCYRPHPK